MRPREARPGFCKLRLLLFATKARALENATSRASEPRRPGHELDIRALRAEVDAVRDYLEALREFRRFVTVHYGRNVAVERRRPVDVSATVTSQCGNVRVESAFVFAAASYGKRHGIEYSTWREIGVGDDVLREAGICRTA